MRVIIKKLRRFLDERTDVVRTTAVSCLAERLRDSETLPHVTLKAIVSICRSIVGLGVAGVLPVRDKCKSIELAELLLLRIRTEGNELAPAAHAEIPQNVGKDAGKGKGRGTTVVIPKKTEKDHREPSSSAGLSEKRPEVPSAGVQTATRPERMGAGPSSATETPSDATGDADNHQMAVAVVMDHGRGRRAERRRRACPAQRPREIGADDWTWTRRVFVAQALTLNIEY